MSSIEPSANNNRSPLECTADFKNEINQVQNTNNEAPYSNQQDDPKFSKLQTPDNAEYNAIDSSVPKITVEALSGNSKGRLSMGVPPVGRSQGGQQIWKSG